ncbi:hypothetical protein A2801_04335 [Candidatus Woesebacteria bacterium RIFCSPHIGHO2_01_FULL_41_10]|uniref:Lysine decarboxylase n=1 Tax=Candidatus Woesebacteria bacterium RIFCSPHIGHO2_01_FULL_41_10 TaxID=1802500 RepID=A0A1F7YLK2_9BACT|nr:MAG: hypothetical protein A2801_04335 [Candidatus Woesebacteria bacterium RIFCSPHIGHO2_01_FULL_41_10]
MEKQYQARPHRPFIKNIAFFGDANLPENDPVYVSAYELAKKLATERFTIVNGGGPGVMNASTHGAEEAGGETLAVTFSPNDAPGFEGRYLGNVTDIEIKTANYIERMFKLMEHADLYVIFKGGSGTISEFGTAWVLGKLYYGHHKPFILYGDFWKEIIEVIVKNMNIDKQEKDVFRIVSTPEDVVESIDHFEHILAKIDHESDCKVCSDFALHK